MATATGSVPSDVVILRSVPFRSDVQVTNATANHHFKMAYPDSTLEIVSPRRLEQECPSRKFAQVVTTVAQHFDIAYEVTSGTIEQLILALPCPC